MATKKCPNGHIYDPSVYGDNCPFCPSTGATVSNNEAGHTRVNNDGGQAPTGETKPTVPVSPNTNNGGGGGATVIKHIGQDGKTNTGRKIVGLLVCYDHAPMGEVFHICEGRNTVGRKGTCDIVIKGDGEISSDHLQILYRKVENAFRLKDLDSSNGTFINGEFKTEAVLKSGDIITIGTTRLIFVAIPQLS